MARSYRIAGRTQAFAAMAAVKPDGGPALRAVLASFNGGTSPLAKLPEHHYARWLVIPQFHDNGPPQKPDVLKSEYLLYSACFDGVDLDAYLAHLESELAPLADAVWGNCVGFRGPDDLARYLRHNEIPLSILFAEYPDASVQDVRSALALRQQLTDFVVRRPGTGDAVALRKAWRDAFGDERG